MYSQIVVPLDGGAFSRRALGPALEVAAASDAAVVLVAFARDEDGAAELLRAVDDTAKGLPREVRHRVDVVPDVAAAIVDEVAADPGSLVCMSSVGRAHTQPLLGSVAEAVLRNVSTPVLLVGPAADVDNFRLDGTIEVPVDGSETAQGILPIAASWAIVYHLGLRVVTVAPADLPRQVQGETVVESGYVRHVAEKLQGDVARPVDFDVLHGDDAAACIVDDAARQASLIAMATHGRTGLARVAAGSVAMRVVHNAVTPVLLYRPLDLNR